MNFCKYVNVFQGSGETDLPEPKGIASTWFFIKAQCGNTSPAARLPFGKMSTGPFSGGYPTGYGSHLVNTSGKPGHMKEGNGLLGFTHFHHSGTGGIGYYYNYGLVTPYYTELKKYEIKNESAEPGFYAVTLEDICCELTVSGKAALHRYIFGRDGGNISVDFSNDGLTEQYGKAYSESSEVILLNKNTAAAKVVMQGIPLYMAVRLHSSFVGMTLWRNDQEITGDELIINEKTKDTFGVRFNLGQERRALLLVAISIKDLNTALSDLNSASADFDSARKKAFDEWNRALSKIEIETDSKSLKEVFYSNLYHSFVKPCDFSDESFIYDDGAFVVDLSTLWDIYKTQLPLVFSLFGGISEKICETLIRLTDTLGFMPNSVGISSNVRHEQQQARMLGSYALLSACRIGINVDPHRVLRTIHKDLYADDKKDFIETGRCASATWILDMADCCAYAASLAKELGETELYEDFYYHSTKWINAYDKNTGLLTADSSYYEGTLYNYSFRPSPNIEDRIRLFKDQKDFISALDKFFGFGQPSVEQPSDKHPDDYIRKMMLLGRFQGFNNEPDMETPYTYSFAGRHDQTCRVLRAGMEYMFTTGRGGLPGNNDSGGLSSCYVWNALGIFPVAGSEIMLIGSPILNGARIHLFNGNTFEIKVYNNSKENIYVKKAVLNGREIKNFRFNISEVTGGGLLQLWMDKKRGSEC
jgi:predicted alpha-1,2-mannosidase